MGTARASGRKLTYDDFLLFPDDGQRHELIDGEHYVTPSPFIRHQELLKRLAYSVESHLRLYPEQGQMFFAPLDCVMTYHDVVEPDLFVVTEDQRQILTDKHVHGVPALVVEILSAGSRRLDERLKRNLYDRVGVLEFWLIDPRASTITVYRRDPAGAFVPLPSFGVEDTIATPLLPRFTFALGELFA
jgi:Uma2 family endonuclease